ncbi:PPR26 phosphatase, partial [Turnix velox]|nr:PPR26 phosphatase [Turnix velox]
MFLMNASPLVALQTKWESFGPARNCRYPLCFSTPEGDITTTSVSAKVQMIINNLQSQEPPLGMNNEYDCIMQKKPKREKGRVPSGTTLLEEHPQYTQCACPDGLDDAEGEESVGFETLLLDSDSDDSVDRGIEEAIQEYLKAKSKSDQSLERKAECSENLSRDKRFEREFSQNEVASSLLPVKFQAEMLSEDYLSDHLGIAKRLQPSSPQSISSDDSFEQSIQAEIVQFLNEKKQQEISKCVTGKDKKDSQVRAVLKCSKETSSKANCGAVKRGCDALLLGHHPKLRKTSSQSKIIPEELPDFNQVKQDYLDTATPSQPWLVGQNEGGGNYWETEKMPSSDSSSDDGIEEAIQLYQLEKIKKEAGRAAGCVPLQRDQFATKDVEEVSASLLLSSAKSASPESHQSPVRKEINPKSTGLESSSSDLNKLFKPLKKARRFAPPQNKLAACELTLQASCRADTSAELMCAEAILDISKTIMPSQMGSDSKTLTKDSFFAPQLLSSSSHCESDSSLVDSDDSIEQEIRAFLALKAQSESLGTKPASLSHSIHMPSDQNNLTGGSLQPSLPKTLKLSLSQKRRLKREGRIEKKNASKPPEQMEVGPFQPGNCSEFPLLQESCALSSSAELCEAQNLVSKETGQPQLVSSGLSGSVPLDSVNPLMQVQSSAGKLVKNPIPTQERDRSDDESSSLDSDEDLDSAIKELLRSKRKVKKKHKEQRSQGKKRVRFNESETQLVDEFRGLQQSEWKSKNPELLKSCLSKRRKAVKENAERNPQDRLSSDKTESVKNLELNSQLKKGSKSKPAPNQNNLRVAKNRKCSFTAVSDADDSSSVDSDDSIEQEIRKFLAEKAKDSPSSSEGQKDAAVQELFKETKQSVDKGKAKLDENEIDPVLGGKEKTEVSQQQPEELKSSQRTEGKSAMLQGSGKSAPSPGNVHPQPKAKQGATGVKSVAELPGNAAGKKDVPPAEAVQKTPSTKSSKNEGCKAPKAMSAKSRGKRKNTFHLKISSKFIAGLKYARDRKKSMLLSKRQKEEGLLTQSSAEVASQGTDGLHQRKGALMAEGEFSGECTTAMKESTTSQKLTVEASSPQSCERLEAAPLCIKEEAEGCGKAGASGEQLVSHSSPPSEELGTVAVKADEVCRGTSEAEKTQMWMEGGDTHKGSGGDSNLDPPQPEQGTSPVKAENLSRNTFQQSVQEEEKQQDRRPDLILACPQQESNVTAVAMDKTSGGEHTDNSMQICDKKEKEVMSQDNDRQEEVEASKVEGKTQDRENAGEMGQGQEVLDKSCAKFTDAPAGDSPDSLLQREVSNM